MFLTSESKKYVLNTYCKIGARIGGQLLTVSNQKCAFIEKIPQVNS